ncbi:High-affinity nitrate transporter 3.1, partial [Mucuna pruriens]
MAKCTGPKLRQHNQLVLVLILNTMAFQHNINHSISLVVLSSLNSYPSLTFLSEELVGVENMVAHGLVVASLVICCLAASCYGKVHFSSLKNTLDVTASPKQGQVLAAGIDKITVTWSLNKTLPAGTDSAYKTIKLKLCYAPISQRDRAWRKTEDELSRDKTCQHKIVAKPYDAANKTVQRFQWLIERDVPQATYFVRAYALDSNDVEVAYGQTTDAKKSTNLFEINAISGRHASLDICSICFSAFSVVSLFAFFYIEKRKAKASSSQK